MVTIGYTVNQIGGVLSSLQEKKEKIQKSLNCIENMGKTYRLDSSLINHMQSELIKNISVSKDLNIKEENYIILSFSEGLR